MLTKQEYSQSILSDTFKINFRAMDYGSSCQTKNIFTEAFLISFYDAQRGGGCGE
jgi:hypothetical protein